MDPTTLQRKHTFDYAVVEVSEPMVFRGGSGATSVQSDDVGLLQNQARLRPAKWEDHLGLLAAVNRRTAQHTESVSPWCFVTYLSTDSDGAHGKSFSNPGEPTKGPGIETLIGGIDAFELTKGMGEAFQRQVKGEDPIPPTIDEDGQRAVEGRP
jgi:hypothetical protein